MAIEEKILVERRFRVPAGPGEPQEAILTWKDLTSEHVVVVLGEPGSGKSTEFEEAGKQPGAIALPIRTFLRVLLDSADLRSKTLFLDALDEMRSGPNRHEVLDSVIQRLEQLDRPKVRLSCRAADWFGGLDRSELASVSPSGEVRVVELLPLTEDEVERIVQSHLGDPSEFLARVRQQRLEGWLGNPQTLELMIKVAREGRLPETRSELFENACALMAGEENRSHRARQGPIGRQQILEAAGFLCALTLIAGLGGFAGDKADSEVDFPPLDEIPGSLDGLRAAIGTRLFRWQEGRAMPVHRTIAEFLAARTLRDRLATGLPLARVLRLITGFDGGTLSDLRGLYAWLTTLVPQHAPYLASKDPVALIFYGDPEVLPPDAKRVVLSSIEELADRDPWFFYEGGSAEPFGGLADPTLIPDFRAALLEPNRHNYLRLSVTAALAYGRPLPELKDDLQRVVYSQDFAEGIRELGLKALCNVSTDEELLTYLDDVQAGRILDENDNQRAYLLGRLYPGILNTAAINQYLTRRKSPQSYFGYYTFLRKALLSRTPDKLVPDLLDSLSASQVSLRFRGDRVWPRLAGPLLRKGVELYGESIPINRLWQWLQVAQDGSHLMILSAEDQTALRDWFSNRPQLVTELFKWWVEEGANWETTNSAYEFWRTLYDPERPLDLWRWQLATAGRWPEDRKGKTLFRLAIQAAFREASSSTLNELYAWVEQNPSFKKDLEMLSVSEYTLLFHDKEGEERDRQEAEKEAAVKARNRIVLEKILEEMRRGSGANLLAFLAEIFLDSTVAPGDPKGLQRIEAEYGPKIAAAAVDGFKAILERHDLPTPEQIGRAEANKRSYYVGFPSLVGMMILFKEGKLPHLGTPGARVALAFEFAHGVFEETGWYEEAIRREPEAAAQIIRAAWTPLLKKKAKEIPHLYNIDREPTIGLIAKRIGFRLLESFPGSAAILLEQLMRCALVGSSREDLARLASKRRSHLDLDQSLLWTAFSILVLPEQGLKRAAKGLRGADRDKKAIGLLNHLREFDGIGEYSLLTSTSSVLADLVLLLGRDCPPQRLMDNAEIRDWEAAQFIGGLIDEMGNRTDDESASRLRALRGHRALLLWREKLGHVVEQQCRKVREARYQRPNLPDVLKVLENREPISLPDLHALTCDHLRTLKNEIENGPESEYRSFWKVGSREELESPVPENEARNRLRFTLNNRLKPLGISAEIEPHYAHGKRGDLKMIYRSMNIPLEAKRHFHREAWIAPLTQLKKKYSIDPGAGGFGIYLVFWFGLAKDRHVPAPPNGIAPPSTASEMEAALRQIYSGEEWQNTEFICIDCSVRETEKQARKRRTQQSNPKSRRAPRQKGK